MDRKGLLLISNSSAACKTPLDLMHTSTFKHVHPETPEVCRWHDRKGSCAVIRCFWSKAVRFFYTENTTKRHREGDLSGCPSSSADFLLVRLFWMWFLKCQITYWRISARQNTFMPSLSTCSLWHFSTFATRNSGSTITFIHPSTSFGSHGDAHPQPISSYQPQVFTPVMSLEQI